MKMPAFFLGLLVVYTSAFAANITCTTTDFSGREGSKNYSVSFPRIDYQTQKLDLSDSALRGNKIEVAITGAYPGDRRFLTISLTQPSGAEAFAEGLASDLVTLRFLPIQISCSPAK